MTSSPGIKPLETDVDTALRLVKVHFSTVQETEVYPRPDFETGEDITVRNVAVRGPQEQIMDEYDDFTRAWLVANPWPKSTRVTVEFKFVG